MKKFFRILLIIIFPLGIIYCIGKNLFGGNFSQFLGGVFLCAVGASVAIYFLRYDLIESMIAFTANLFA